jgi:hypothetical protein
LDYHRAARLAGGRLTAASDRSLPHRADDSNQSQNPNCPNIRAQPSRCRPIFLQFAAGKFERETRTIANREMTMYHRETDREKVDA